MQLQKLGAIASYGIVEVQKVGCYNLFFHVDHRA